MDSSCSELQPVPKVPKRPRPRKEPTLTCLVCGGPSTCSTYGAVNCYPCSIFFNKYVGKNKTYKCKSKNDPQKCPIISGNTRKCCKLCRYQKCLAIGMRPEMVRQCEKQAVTHLGSNSLSEMSQQEIANLLTSLGANGFSSFPQFQGIADPIRMLTPVPVSNSIFPCSSASPSDPFASVQSSATIRPSFPPPYSAPSFFPSRSSVLSLSSELPDRAVSAPLAVTIPSNQELRAPVIMPRNPKTSRNQNQVKKPSQAFLIDFPSLEQASISLSLSSSFNWVHSFCSKSTSLEFILSVASRNLLNFKKFRATTNPFVSMEDLPHLLPSVWISLHIFDIALATIQASLALEYVLENGELVSPSDIGLLGLPNGSYHWEDVLRTLQVLSASSTNFALIHTMLIFQKDPKKIQKIVDFIGEQSSPFSAHIFQVSGVIQGLSNLIKDHLDQEKTKGAFEPLENIEEYKMVLDLI